MKIPAFTSPLILPAVGLLVFFSGCSVFGPVGEWFSQGYENTVTYFNAYYNARRLFTEAEEEILAANLSTRGKTPAAVTSASIPNTAKQKLTLVIDKCSKILSFSPTSSFVDDALFLIGKANFYQGEYVKAERKFSELLAQFPNGPLALDSQLWFLKTLHRLGRYEDAERAGEILMEAAASAEEPEIAGEASVTMGEIAEEQNNLSLAVGRYEGAIELLNDDFQRATIQAKVGDILMVMQDYRAAMSAYQKIGGYSSDLYLLYYGRIQAARAARELKDYQQALDLFEELLGDFRFFQYENVIRYEVGRTLAQEGEVDEAIQQFRYVDTTFARTEIGVKAAYELGQLLQYQVGDYDQARIAYEHASSLPALEESRRAQKLNTALSKYFELQKRYEVGDSVLAFHSTDSLWPAPDTSQVIEKSMSLDSIMQSESTDADSTREIVLSSIIPGDSLAADSTQGNALVVMMQRDSLAADSTVSAPAQRRLNPDSLRAVLSKVAYELGELFYSELEVPDSSMYWYTQSLRLHLDSAKAGRTYFILAEIIRSNPDKKYGEAEDYYRKLLQQDPGSPYAEEARVRLGIPKPAKDVDQAESAYAKAESLMVAGADTAALVALKNLVRMYPDSPFAAKSDLALAWMYEKQLAQRDSALAYYHKVVERYAATEYAKIAQRRIANPEADASAPQPVVPDSLAKPVLPQGTPEKPKIEMDPEEERLFKARSDSARTRRGTLKEEH